MEIRKRKMKFITTLFVAMALFMLCETGDVKAKDAYHEHYDGWVYSEQHGGKVVQITGSYEEKRGNIIIPETINGQPVTEMANGSDSYSWGNIETITLPKSLIEIKSSVFSGCTGLRSVEIPNSVTKIGVGAFARCTGLRSVEIPNSVREIYAADRERPVCRILFRGGRAYIIRYTLKSFGEKIVFSMEK